MHEQTKEWWLSHKDNYIFDPNWFEAFKEMDGRLVLPPLGPDGVRKMGVVFWHQPDGKTVIPVGVTYQDNKRGEEGHLDSSEFIFCYHPDYVNDKSLPPISQSLPKEKQIFHFKEDDYGPYALLPYFDNLVAESWLGMMQHNALQEVSPKPWAEKADTVKVFTDNDDASTRYERMLTFGRGFHGAVAVVDVTMSDMELNSINHKYLNSFAAIGGFQSKFLAVRHGDAPGHVTWTPAARDDQVTHIAKVAAPINTSNQDDNDCLNTAKNEYLNIVATRALLPEDTIVEAELGHVKNGHNGDYDPLILFVKRFDRTHPENGRLHFEEALQIIGKTSGHKYYQTYKDLADVTRNLMGEEGVRRVFKRVLAQFLLGNADGHFKNFAFWKPDGEHWDLTPNYDLVSSDRYPELDGSVALLMYMEQDSGGWGAPAQAKSKAGESAEDQIPEGKVKEQGRDNSNGAEGKEYKKVAYKLQQFRKALILELGKNFGLGPDEVSDIANELLERVPAAQMAVRKISDPEISQGQKNRFCDLINFRRNRQLGAFQKLETETGGPAEKRSVIPEGSRKRKAGE